MVQEALKFFVWSSSLKHNLNVIFHLGLVCGCLFEADHSSGVSEQILWEGFRSIKSTSLIGIKPSGEWIAINNSENSLINIEVHSNLQVLPCVVFRLIIWEWKLVSLKEDTLWNSRVLNLRLKDVDGIVIKEIVNPALSASKVFIWIFNNWLDEEGFENENLLIKY